MLGYDVLFLMTSSFWSMFDTQLKLVLKEQLADTGLTASISSLRVSQAGTARPFESSES